jgi:hypothetical protein
MQMEVVVLHTINQLVVHQGMIGISDDISAKSRFLTDHIRAMFKSFVFYIVDISAIKLCYHIKYAFM